MRQPNSAALAATTTGTLDMTDDRDTTFAELRTQKDRIAGTTIAAMFDKDPKRYDRFHVKLGDLVFDYSKHRIDDRVLAALMTLARTMDVEAKRDLMFSGEIVNPTEHRPALHTALRNFSGKPVKVDGKDVMPEVEAVRAKVAAFAAGIRDGSIKGATGPRWRRGRSRPSAGPTSGRISSPTSTAQTSATRWPGSTLPPR